MRKRVLVAGVTVAAVVAATGAAAASACAYSATTLSLIWFFLWLSRGRASALPWPHRALADKDIAR